MDHNPEEKCANTATPMASQEVPSASAEGSERETSLEAAALFKELGIMDKLLTPAILVTMIVGVVIGEFVPSVQPAFDTVRFDSVSVPIAIGLILMMWPILTKVQYETLPTIFRSRKIWTHLLLSLLLNWVVGPLVMLAVAWATLPDLPTYRTGVVMVGLARCIAMVLVWNQLARGDAEYCAVLVVVNSVMQIVLYSPYALLFINTIGGGGADASELHVTYGEVAVSVLIYLGIPLALGVATRYTVWTLTSRHFLDTCFLPFFSPLAPLGLLYTVLVLFAYQGHHILHRLGPVFRVFVPLVLYFVVMWSGAFGFLYWLSRREEKEKGEGEEEEEEKRVFGYEMTVVQAFTAGSNNFELAIAVAIAVYGVGSDQALAVTIGPLVEVPVLLALTWVALFLRRKLHWTGTRSIRSDGAANV